MALKTTLKLECIVFSLYKDTQSDKSLSTEHANQIIYLIIPD